MKKIFTLIMIASCSLVTRLDAQNCTSPASSYNLVVTSFTTIGPAATAYMTGYVCPGATLMDSAMCCTRVCNVDSGATLIAGPNSYGAAYVKSGGTFNGQNVSINWQVFAEPGANIINNTGGNIACPVITFTGGSCALGFVTPDAASASVSQIGNQLNFIFTDVLKSGRIELYDLSGKLVNSTAVIQSTTQTIDVSELPDGMYMYRVLDGEKLIGTNKVVIAE